MNGADRLSSLHFYDRPAAVLLLSSSRPCMTPPGPIHRPGPWGCSSIGRAPEWHSGGRGFDPHQLHFPCAFDESRPRGVQGLAEPKTKLCSSYCCLSFSSWTDDDPRRHPRQTLTIEAPNCISPVDRAARSRRRAFARRDSTVVSGRAMPR
jgi:hypothetical protein